MKSAGMEAIEAMEAKVNVLRDERNRRLPEHRDALNNLIAIYEVGLALLGKLEEVRSELVDLADALAPRK